MPTPVPNNRPGILDFRERIVSLIRKYEFDQILFGLEHTGCYSMHVAMYLERHLDFDCKDVRVYAFNPSLIKQFKKARYLDAPTNDRVSLVYRIQASIRPSPASLHLE